MGTSMFWVNESPIFDATLKKFPKPLWQKDFVGHIDINCIVNGNGIFPLEFTSRFRLPAKCTFQRDGIMEPLGNMFYKIASGKSLQSALKKGFQIGAYIVVPPFQFDDKKALNYSQKTLLSHF
ncbi:MAG: hypothetical protein R2821_01665 [Flavobacteriaceae bacterium]